MAPPPRVRTLVWRGWAAPAALDLPSDARSAKAAELRREPSAEVCWLLPKARRQFRLRGMIHCIGAGVKVATPLSSENATGGRSAREEAPSGPGPTPHPKRGPLQRIRMRSLSDWTTRHPCPISFSR